MIEFQMPSLGADMEDGTLVEWRKKPGDTLQRGDIIADVDTQKGLIEIEVFEEGKLEKILVEEGAKVPVGTVMALITPFEEGIKQKGEEPAVKSSPESPLPNIPTSDKIIPDLPSKNRPKATPLAKRIAAENKIDLNLLKGTGPDGTIVKEDVEHSLGIEKAVIYDKEKEQENLTSPELELKKDPSPPPFTAIRMAVAAAMSKSNREIPHYYLEKMMDMTGTLAWLKNVNSQLPVKKRILLSALLIKAVAKALEDVPDLNGIWENGLQVKNEINIGFVVSLRAGGLMVPALKNADLKSLDEIMEWLNDVIPRARAFKLRSSELTDSTITLTSLGEGNADKVFGIIYPPQVAILGFGSVTEQPFAVNGMLGVRSVIYVTLGADHRATDGLIGSKFLVSLNNHLKNPQNL